MRWFWAILGVVVAAAIIVLFQPPQGSRVDPRAVQDDTSLVNEVVRPEKSTAPTPAKDAGPTPVATDKPAALTSSAEKELVDELLTERAKTAANVHEAASPPKDEGEALQLGLDAQIANATVKASRLSKLPNGSIVADGKWTITGEGTERNPYVVPWELLVSAMDTYQPRAQLRDIPQRIAFLDGKRVRVEGYIIFPLVVQQAQQCLLTFNQWDGCCIGIPPSAYDAIEVNLSSSIPINRKHGLLFGGVEGILHVAPLLSEGWLYGLYAMDDARLKLEM